MKLSLNNGKKYLKKSWIKNILVIEMKNNQLFLK